MTIRKLTCCAALLLSVSLAPLLASAPAPTGNDNAAARITAAMDKQTQVLTGLLSKVPAEAVPAVQDAINASTQGRDNALAALASHSTSGTSTTTPATTSSSDSAEAGDTEQGTGTQSGTNTTKTTGLTHARDMVSAAFAKSEAKLQTLITKLPDKAVPHVQAALTNIEANHARTLANLDGLIAKQASD